VSLHAINYTGTDEQIQRNSGNNGSMTLTIMSLIIILHYNYKPVAQKHTLSHQHNSKPTTASSLLCQAESMECIIDRHWKIHSI